MNKGLVLAMGLSFGVGAAVAACGSSGKASSGTTGSTASGTGGAGGSTGSGTAGGVGFDSGVQDAPVYDGDACGSTAIVTHPTPGNLVVVFDQSDSMNQSFSVDGGATGKKYVVAEDALVAAVMPNQALLNVGAIFFPTINTGNLCSGVDPIGTPPQIPIEPGAMFDTDFQAHFSAPGWKLLLGTPLKVALDNANMALPDPSPLKGQRAVVIITDGAPTCDTVKADILAPVQAMASRGIKTYAVGLPGSANASNLLDAIAMAGGTGSYISPSDPTTLQDTLASIASDTLDKCTVTLDPPPPDPSKVYLIVTDPAHPQGYEIPETDGGAGWTISADGSTATLTGAVCASAKKGDYTSIQFVYGCPVLP